jgi:hypothetical protein
VLGDQRGQFEIAGGRVMKRKRTTADLKREAEAMVAAGTMPTFEEVLRAVAEAKLVYKAKAKFERLKKSKVMQ